MSEGQAVEATVARVKEFLDEVGVSQVNPTTFAARRGSAVVAIRVYPWGEEGRPDETMVEVRSNVVEGAQPLLSLYRQLLEFNDEAAYGAFGVGEDGLITYHHCLLGSTLTPAELSDAVHDVAQVADDWDDVIIDQAGGKTAVDKLQELKRPKLRPTIEAPRQPADSGQEG